MIERIKRLRRGPRRRGNTVLRTACGLKLRRYDLARKWRLGRAALPFSRLTLCLLGRPRTWVAGAAPSGFYKQPQVQNSVRLFDLRNNFRFTILLSRFERYPEIRYVPVRSKTLRPSATREVFTTMLPSLPLHVPVGSSRSSGAVTSVRHAIAGARHREKVPVQHRFSSGRGSQAGGFERISFKPLSAVQSRSMAISQSQISILPSLRQPRLPNQPRWTSWSIAGPAKMTLPHTTARLMKHSDAATPGPQETTAGHFLRKVKTFSVSRQRSAARKILPDTVAPPSSIASTYRPINIELVNRQVSTRSSSAPAIDSLERTRVVSNGNRPEVTSRRETAEKEINEKIHQQVERTVREQVERTFRKDTVLVQRLSREIQSDLYRGIVFERERLGLR